MKTYIGRRDKSRNSIVRVIEAGDSRELPLRLDLFNHSPSGFNWGYGGSGPAQLALAILADALKDDKTAVRLHQSFKFRYVGSFNDAWRLTEEDVLLGAVELAKPNALVREPDGHIYLICGDCARHLREKVMLKVDRFGVHDIAPGILVEQLRAIAKQRHEPRGDDWKFSDQYTP